MVIELTVWNTQRQCFLVDTKDLYVENVARNTIQMSVLRDRALQCLNAANKIDREKEPWLYERLLRQAHIFADMLHGKIKSTKKLERLADDFNINQFIYHLRRQNYRMRRVMAKKRHSEKNG